MKKNFFSIAMFIGFLFITNSKFLIAQDFLWAKQIGGLNEDDATSITTDAFGNVYTTGSLNGTVDFDPGSGTFNLTSSGEIDAFISKLDASGSFVWAKQLGGASYDITTSITTDASGNVYTTGYFGGTADFDPGPGTYNLIAAYFTDIFISKLDASGNFVWAKQLGGESNEIAYSINTDAFGNVYTTGYFEGTADFDPGSGTFNLTSAGDEDVFISKLDSSGNFLWAKKFGGLNGDYAFSISTDIYGNVYTNGQFWGIADFDPGSGIYNLTSAGEHDIFINKLNASGNFVWAKQIGGQNTDHSYSLAVDSFGNVYTTGYFWGIVDFDPGSGTYNLASAGEVDIFINKLNASGNFEWAKQMGGVAYDISNSITTDASGYVYATGSFSDTVDFDPGIGITNLASSGDTDVFVCKLDASGNFIWAFNFGGIHEDNGRSSNIDDAGYVYTTGSFYGTADFDPGPGSFNMISAGNEDVFILKTTSCYIPAAPTALSSQIYAGSSIIDSLTASGTNLLWYNAATGGAVLPGSTTLNDDTTYFVSQSSGVCESPRTAVTVNKISEAMQTFCSPATVADLVTTPSPGSTAFWYNSAIATTPLNISDTLISGNYYVEQNISSKATSLGNEFISAYGVSIETARIIQVADLENNSIHKTISDSVSNRVKVHVEVNTNNQVSVSIQASTNNECEGIPVTFTATPTNGGANPSYQWQVNGINAGINLSTYTYSPSDNDTVKVILTSSDFCTSNILATSNSIGMTVNPLLVFSVNISSSTNNVCEGTPVTFFATSTNSGANPSYQWQVNSVNTGTNSVTFTYSPSNNDGVKVIMTSSELCVLTNPVTSNTITVTTFPVPAKPFIIVNCDTLTSSSASGNQWYKSNDPINGAVNQQYIVTENGFYSVKVTLNGCSSEMSDQENVIITGSFNSGEFGNVNLYPNPVTGKFTIDIPLMRLGDFTMSVLNNAGAVVYSSKYTFAASGHKFLVDISGLANGMYTLLIRQDDITLARKLILKK